MSWTTQEQYDDALFHPQKMKKTAWAAIRESTVIENFLFYYITSAGTLRIKDLIT